MAPRKKKVVLVESDPVIAQDIVSDEIGLPELRKVSYLPYIIGLGAYVALAVVGALSLWLIIF